MLDGHFHNNASIQISNKLLDFQLCEPLSSLFGCMNSNNIMPEFQITQECLSH
ncbi:MAG: hypothetical protein HUJ51_07025 [Eggerthellaceae bacterium]|nr:hypothetical protein [Eggerthellaceae bacterium]